MEEKNKAGVCIVFACFWLLLFLSSYDCMIWNSFGHVCRIIFV